MLSRAFLLFAAFFEERKGREGKEESTSAASRQKQSPRRRNGSRVSCCVCQQEESLVPLATDWRWNLPPLLSSQRLSLSLSPPLSPSRCSCRRREADDARLTQGRRLTEGTGDRRHTYRPLPPTRDDKEPFRTRAQRLRRQSVIHDDRRDLRWRGLHLITSLRFDAAFDEGRSGYSQPHMQSNLFH